MEQRLVIQFVTLRLHIKWRISGNKNMQFFSMNDVMINGKQHFKVATQNFYMTKIR